MDAPTRKTSRKPAGTKAGKQNSGGLWQEIRRQMIAEAAYYRAEHRGFMAGGDLGDWLEAEKEIDRRLNGSE